MTFNDTDCNGSAMRQTWVYNCRFLIMYVYSHQLLTNYVPERNCPHAYNTKALQ